MLASLPVFIHTQQLTAGNRWQAKKKLASKGTGSGARA
jgi:hypothetical protein